MQTRFNIWRFVVVLAFLMACGTSKAAPSDELTSFIPKKNLAQFIADNFDIRSIRSSIRPDRLTPNNPTFASLGLHPRVIGNDTIRFESHGWIYDIRILGRGDENKDGIEDIAVCFTDDGSGAGGTYLTVQPLLLTRYSDKTPLIAISYEVFDSRCNAYKR